MTLCKNFRLLHYGHSFSNHVLLYVLFQLVSKRSLEVNIINDLLINIYIPVGYLYFWLPQGNGTLLFLADWPLN